jgi:1-deoxy-D-xylulose-5-phosphate reductoisomerase
MKRVAILGSTGSIGKQTLEIIRIHKDAFEVVALSAASNIEELNQQCLEFSPKIACIEDASLAKQVKATNIVIGSDGLCQICRDENVDIVVMAIVGYAALLPTLAAIKANKRVALANKECLVAGGELIMQALKNSKADLIPIDSEQSAIFQCLQKHVALSRLILTASGGPFFRYSDQELESIDVKAALNHPSWKMGPKNTIDSSTLLNKGLEVIEAHFLFDVPLDKIEVVIHPQSVIHSLVEYVDSSMIAQLSEPTMTLPIQYALTYPERKPSLCPPFNFLKARALEFYPVDTKRFKCLQLCIDAARMGGSAPCFLNAANEVLVSRFLKKEITWHQIGDFLEELMQQHKPVFDLSLDSISEIDLEARSLALGGVLNL